MDEMKIDALVEIFLSGFIGLVGLCLILAVFLKITEPFIGIGTLWAVFLILGIIGFSTIIGVKITEFMQ